MFYGYIASCLISSYAIRSQLQVKGTEKKMEKLKSISKKTHHPSNKTISLFQFFHSISYSFKIIKFAPLPKKRKKKEWDK